MNFLIKRLGLYLELIDFKSERSLLLLSDIVEQTGTSPTLLHQLVLRALAQAFQGFNSLNDLQLDGAIKLQLLRMSIAF